MSPKTRRILFLTLAFLFLSASVFLILYATGTKLDLQNLRLVRTGGIYIESKPPDVKIYLDGKEIKNKSGLLQTGTFISELTPRRYKLVLQHADYHEWQKEVEVLGEEVVVFNKIVLLPRAGPEKISEAPEKFYIQNERVVIKNGSRLTYEGRELLGEEVVVLLEGGSIITKNSRTGTYYLTNLLDLRASLNLSLIFQNLKETRLNLPGLVNILEVRPYPYNERKFILRTGGALYTLDSERLSIEQIGKGPRALALGRTEVFWLEKESLFSYSLPLRNKSELVKVKLEAQEVRLEVSPSGGWLTILGDNGQLFLYKKDSRKVLAIAHKAKELAFSYNSKFLGFIDSDGPLNIYDLEKEIYLQIKPEFAPQAQELTWYKDNAHFFLRAGDKLYFLEVHGKPNIYLISDKIHSFSYEKDVSRLYFTKPDGLFQLEI